MSSLRAQNLSDKGKLILWKRKGVIILRVPKKYWEERQGNKANKIVMKYGFWSVEEIKQ